METPLETLYNLDLVVKRLGDGTLTRVTLRNRLGFSDGQIDAALKYGYDNEYLKWEQGNYYSVIKDFVIPEDCFYDPIKQSIEKLWTVEKYESSEFYVEKTARKNSKIAGPWTRPDLTLVSFQKFPFTIGQEFDVVTFEIKRPDTCNVLAVFEALSHASAATRAYVVFPINAQNWIETDPAQERRVKDECAKHGVGLILIEDVYGIDPKPCHLIKARKREIDHDKCSDFLDVVVSQDGKSRISKWK